MNVYILIVYSRTVEYTHISNSCVYCRGRVKVSNGVFSVSNFPYTVSNWTHIVLNFIGPEEGQGIRFYVDGVQAKSSTSKTARIYPPGDGRVVVGRLFSDRDFNYGGVSIDELLFFNQILEEFSIQRLISYT